MRLTLTAKILRISKVVEAKVRESGTALTELSGVGALTAARIIGEVGDVRKIKSKAALVTSPGPRQFRPHQARWSGCASTAPTTDG
jgi:transposase